MATFSCAGIGAYTEDTNSATLLKSGQDLGNGCEALVAQPISIHPHCIGRAPNAGPQGKEYLLDGSAYCMDSRGRPQAVAQSMVVHGTQDPCVSNGAAFALGCNNGGENAVMQSIGWSEELTASIELAGTIQRGGQGGRHEGVMTPTMAVRRLTPVECERLQGFPDGWTNIPWRKKPAHECPDGPRYKALGNSWAVPVVRWIGGRIKLALEVAA